MPIDIDLDAHQLVIQCGKGGKRRVVGIGERTGARLEQWLARRRKLGMTDRKHVFCTLHGDRMSSSYVRQMLPRLAKRAGLPRELARAHNLRHTLAHELVSVSEGVPITTIRDQLGHASLATTDRNLRGISPKVVIDAMLDRERPPVVEPAPASLTVLPGGGRSSQEQLAELLAGMTDEQAASLVAILAGRTAA